MTNNPQNPLNPFQILGLAPSFTISPSQIQHAYLHKLSTTHPDLVSQESIPSPDQLDPATLNQARDTLLNDESRANLMLHLLDGPSPKDKSLPDGFLMEMMQLRIQIEEELESNPDEARPHWQSWANNERQKTIQTISTLFTQLPPAPQPPAPRLAEPALQTPDHTQLKQQIRTHLNAWRYTERLLEQLDPTYHPSTADS